MKKSWFLETKKHNTENKENDPQQANIQDKPQARKRRYSSEGINNRAEKKQATFFDKQETLDEILACKLEKLNVAEPDLKAQNPPSQTVRNGM